jgi:hypothetical protein
MRLLKKWAILELPYFCSSALLLYCSTALLLYFSFHASRFTPSRFFFTLHGFTLHAKNLPYPSLGKRDFYCA